MTTGLDYTVSNLNCRDNDCLTYKTDPETKWYYHNAPYTLLENVISNAANTSYNDFTNIYLSNKIGISNGNREQLLRVLIPFFGVQQKMPPVLGYYY